jgi:hypothetical protein
MTYISQSAGYSFPAYYEIRPRAIVSRSCPVQDAFYSAGSAIRKTAASKPGLLKIGLLGGITYFFGKKLLNAVQQRWGMPSGEEEQLLLQPPQGLGLVKSVILAGFGIWGAKKLSQGPIKPILMGAVSLLGADKLLGSTLLKWGALGAVGVCLFRNLNASNPLTTSPVSPQAFFAYADALIQQQLAIAKQRFELEVFCQHKEPNSSAYALMRERLTVLNAADDALRQKLAALAMAL